MFIAFNQYCMITWVGEIQDFFEFIVFENSEFEYIDIKFSKFKFIKKF